jgi:hypothetical protein
MLCPYGDESNLVRIPAYGCERIFGKSRMQNHSKTGEWKALLGKAEFLLVVKIQWAFRSIPSQRRR